MRDIKVLIFDDKHEDATLIQDSLCSGWVKHRLPSGAELPNLKFTVRTDTRALDDDLAHASNFDIAFIDILVEKERINGRVRKRVVPEYEGFRYIEKAKSRGLPICIAITKGNNSTLKEWNNFYEKFKQWIDLSVLKDDLFGSNGIDRRQKEIENIVALLLSRGILTPLQGNLVLQDDIQEARTLGAVEQIGRVTLDAFASHFAILGSKKYSVTAMSPGLSGAKIFRVTYADNVNLLGDTSLLLKVSRDRESLLGEIAAFKTHIVDHRRRIKNAIAAPLENFQQPIEINGWFAAGFECVSDSISLLDWVDKSELGQVTTVTQMLDDLYNREGLTQLYIKTRADSRNMIDGLFEGLLTKYRVMAIREAILELNQLIAEFWPTQILSHSSLESLLSSRMVGKHSASQLNRIQIEFNLSHGDLHGRNLLVQMRGKLPQIRIIDLASMGTKPWTVDTVRLCVDLALSCWDRGPASYRWTSVPTWECVADLLICGQLTEGVIAAAKNEATVAALVWLYTNRFLANGIKETANSKGQYLVSLAIELLRASYRVADLTAPKRAFALVAATKAIRAAEQVFD